MKKIAAIALLSTLTVPVFAADEGFYAGLTLGSGKPGVAPAGVTLSKNSDFIYGGLLGYQLNKSFAVEGQFTGVGSVKDAAGNKSKGDALSLTGVGFLPLNDSFSLYGKLGVASVKTTTAAGLGVTGVSRTGLTYGIGAQYNVTPQLGLRAGWDSYGAATANAAGVKTNVNASVLSVGAVYQF
ncbi:MAG: porin family protein [Nitrosomonadales bacterium]|nr:porin family protein [Nitrosomonadales bacterium]